MQQVEQSTAARIGQRLEHLVHVIHGETICK
jgi:hypothetical protein